MERHVVIIRMALDTEHRTIGPLKAQIVQWRQGTELEVELDDGTKVIVPFERTEKKPPGKSLRELMRKRAANTIPDYNEGF